MPWRSPWKRWMNRGEQALSRGVFVLAGVLAFACVAFGSVTATERVGSAPRTAPASVWDTLGVLDAATNWRSADSVVTAYIARLDGPVVRDSAGLARGLQRQMTYRHLLGQLRDSSALRAGTRALAIQERLVPRDVRELSRVHAGLSALFVDLDAADSALVHARTGLALAISVVPRDDSLRAWLELREGWALAAQSDLAGAVGSLQSARAHMQAALGDSVSDLSIIHGELGRVFTLMGEFQQANAELLTAVAIAERHAAERPQRLGTALSRRLTLERRLGHVANAVELGERLYALALARSGPEGSLTQSAKVNLGYAVLTLGDHARARTILTSTMAYYRTSMQPTNSSLLQMRVALAAACMKLGDEVAARAQFDTVDAVIATNPKTPSWLVDYNATVRSGLEIRAGRYVEARRRLLSLAHAKPMEIASQGDLAAQLYETLVGREDRALVDSLGRNLDAMADTTGITRVNNWPAILLSRARAEARVGDRTLARMHAAQVESTTTDRFRWEILALTDREALVWEEEAHDAADLLVETAMPERIEDVREAWSSVVRRRGLVREIVEGRRELSAPGDTALAAAHARWVALQQTYAQIVVSGVLDAHDPAARQRFEASHDAVESAERRYARLSALAGKPMEPPTLDRILARLGPDEALVAFMRTEVTRGRPQLSVFVATGRGHVPRLIPLGAEGRISAAIRDWVDALAAPPPADPREARAAEALARGRGETVRRLVWEPVRALLGNVRVVQLVPSGPVLDLPWLALPTTRGRYMAEDSLRVIVRPAERDLLSDAAPSLSRGLLAVGDPDFDLGAPHLVGTLKPQRVQMPGVCTPAAVQLSYLPGARAEAEGIAALWHERHAADPVRLLMGDDATETRFKELSAGHRVLHLATHGVLTRSTCESSDVQTRGVGGVAPVASPPSRRKRANVESAAIAASPEPSPWLGREVWLALAGANRAAFDSTDGNEGWLTANEVVTLDLRGTERVVLSACQSGVVDRWNHDALLGMRRAFHMAGAHAVVASQWAIADAATREWMEAFYASPSPSTAGALQDASRAVLADRRAKGRTTHPFYWAAFTATGD